jgi:hypothetical protein
MPRFKALPATLGARFQGRVRFLVLLPFFHQPVSPYGLGKQGGANGAEPQSPPPGIGVFDDLADHDGRGDAS